MKQYLPSFVIVVQIYFVTICINAINTLFLNGTKGSMLTDPISNMLGK